MVDGFEGIPIKVAAQRLGVAKETVRLMVKKGVLVKIPLPTRVGPHQRYNIDEASLKNYRKSQIHRVDK
jgi:hypothetical protein